MEGTGSGIVQIITDPTGSGRPKTLRILLIRIWNTEINNSIRFEILSCCITHLEHVDADLDPQHNSREFRIAFYCFLLFFLQAGIQFMGPSDHAMWLLGDKVASSIVAQTAAVPTLPWSGSNLLVDLVTKSFLRLHTSDCTLHFSLLYSCLFVQVSNSSVLCPEPHLWSLRILKLLTAPVYFVSVVKNI